MTSSLLDRVCILCCEVKSKSTDYISPGSSVHGILQARILKWVAVSGSRGSFRPRNQIYVSFIGRWILHC